MYQVIKRDGKIVDFNIGKIADAIKKAFEATETEFNDDIIDFLALKVSADFLPKINFVGLKNSNSFIFLEFLSAWLNKNLRRFLCLMNRLMVQMAKLPCFLE